MWLGVALIAAGFFSMLLLLSWENVSFVVPATSLSYAVGALGAQLVLGERVSRARWLGVLLVILGVVLVWLGEGSGAG
jgi:drug/metabolite transporter (DMT)-like permease